MRNFLILFLVLLSVESFAEYSVITDNAEISFYEGELQLETFYETQSFQNGAQFWIMLADFVVSKLATYVEWKSHTIFWFKYRVSVVSDEITCFKLIDHSRPLMGDTTFDRRDQYRVEDYHCRIYLD